MHLLFMSEIFHPYCRGGAGRVAGDVAAELAGRGHRIDLICPVADAQVTRHQLAENFQVLGLPVANMPAGKRIDAPYSPRMLKAIWQFVSAHIDLPSVDLFHDNGGFFRDLFPVEQQLIEALRPRPFIVQYQIQWRPLMEVERQDPSKTPPLLDQQRLLAEQADRILFLSEDEQIEGQTHFAANPGRSLQLPNAIPLERFDAYPFDDKPPRAVPTIALAGRLETRSKGLDFALEALTHLAQDFDFEIRLIGHEPPPETIPPALQGRVSGTGWLDSDGVARALHEATLFLMPSRYEPFGLLALEAQAVGTPVIATATGGLREIILPGETGLLANPLAPVPELREAVARLLQAPEEGRRMALAARARLEAHYTIPLIASRLEALYEEVLTP